MNTLSCLIVEDEPNAMLLLQDHISKVPFLVLKGSCYDAMEAMHFLKEQHVDVLFLDINMPRLTGMELAAMLPASQKIIFTTAYSEYALDSFDYHVIDYLLKPISFKRFMQAVHKLDQVAEKKENKNEAVTEQDFLFVKSGRQMHKISYDSILYIEASKEYLAIHTDTDKLLVYKRMKEVAQQLPAQFIRIHNSYIVNMHHVKSVGTAEVMVKETSLPVSNGYKSQLQENIQHRIL